MTMLLPLAADAHPVSHRESGAAKVDAGGMKILLVEDHEDSLKAMLRLLRRLGHDITTATGVTTALRAASESDFDLLISDLGLPDGTGLQLMKQLLTMRPLKGIALTGYGMESDIQQTRQAGLPEAFDQADQFAGAAGGDPGSGVILFALCCCTSGHTTKVQ